MPKQVEWALVADAGRARILERPGRGIAWSERSGEARRVEIPPSRELGTERPGRGHESVGTARHAVEPRQDLHKAAEQAFARQLTERLEQAANEGAYARLILVAPPTFLGQLREALGRSAAQRLIGTVNKALAHEPLAEITPHLDDVPLP